MGVVNGTFTGPPYRQAAVSTTHKGEKQTLEYQEIGQAVISWSGLENRCGNTLHDALLGLCFSFAGSTIALMVAVCIHVSTIQQILRDHHWHPGAGYRLAPEILYILGHNIGQNHHGWDSCPYWISVTIRPVSFRTPKESHRK